MEWNKTVQLIGVHCEGEIGNVVTSCLPLIPGQSMLEKMEHINNVDKELLEFLVFEPRGNPHGSVNLLFPSSDIGADAGFIVLQPDGAHSMSGSNAICVTTVLLETGILEMHEPKTTVTLETPSGLVKAIASCRNNKCVDVTINMVPSFVEHLDWEIHFEPYGKIKLDIAYGGVFLAIIDVEQIGLSIEKKNAKQLGNIGVSICDAVNSTINLEHPIYPGIGKISYVMFRQTRDGEILTCTTLKPGRVDRSPCGTGTAAIIAIMHNRGLIKPGGEIKTKSIIGSEFQAVFTDTTLIGKKTATLASITGRAWIHGLLQYGVDPTDPYPSGYVLHEN